ncbi:mitochondrial membrane protein [Apophysomyces sp. BC1021]|nr:mitochondrial membrane protein [Apophysomyces sp. BC1021]
MKSESAPMVKEVETSLSPAELEVLRRQYVKEGEYVTIQTKFNYAWGLVKSNNSGDVELGIRLLTEAKRFNQQLLKLEPRNAQALELDQLVDEKVSKEGVIGLAIVSGVVAVGAALVAAIVKRSK